MILRRVISHFRKQEWTAIAIDFVIVVFGVFVGLQVNNWNAARADRQAAANYLADIAADVKADVNETARVAESARTRIAASTHILKQAGSGSLAPAWILSGMSAAALDVFTGNEAIDIPDLPPPPESERNRLWPLATGIYAFDTNKSAYDALIGSGRIELIQKLEIKRALQEYYYLVNSLEETQRRTIMPIRVLLTEKGIEHGLSPESRVPEAELVTRVASDPALAAVVATHREHASLHLLFCNLLDEHARKVLALLDESASRDAQQ